MVTLLNVVARWCGTRGMGVWYSGADLGGYPWYGSGWSIFTGFGCISTGFGCISTGFGCFAWNSTVFGCIPLFWLYSTVLAHCTTVLAHCTTVLARYHHHWPGTTPPLARYHPPRLPGLGLVHGGLHGLRNHGHCVPGFALYTKRCFIQNRPSGPK